ncbi:hypothetical protein [Nitriliruptor alkaliphilus]|uniref:hypothetical protein n=1 Tax=Nitriliruptor alkaliphilus TaxID=427918 RepID=UPI0006972D76|nr:hypothetical protein [Nitriliruptor alkaliphilus]
MRCPEPARASYRDLLRDLLGRAVEVRPGPPQELSGEAPSYLAAYRYDEGEVAALAVADLDLATAAGAAIAMMPPQETRAAVAEAGALDEELLEFFHEVVNVAAKLLNSPTTAHVVLRDLLPVPGEVPDDVAEVATGPRARHDWRVRIEGYGEGTVTLLHA